MADIRAKLIGLCDAFNGLRSDCLLGHRKAQDVGSL